MLVKSVKSVAVTILEIVRLCHLTLSYGPYIRTTQNKLNIPKITQQFVVINIYNWFSCKTMCYTKWLFIYYISYSLNYHFYHSKRKYTADNLWKSNQSDTVTLYWTKNQPLVTYNLISTLEQTEVIKYNYFVMFHVNIILSLWKFLSISENNNNSFWTDRQHT